MGPRGLSLARHGGGRKKRGGGWGVNSSRYMCAIHCHEQSRHAAQALQNRAKLALNLSMQSRHAAQALQNRAKLALNLSMKSHYDHVIIKFAREIQRVGTTKRERFSAGVESRPGAACAAFAADGGGRTRGEWAAVSSCRRRGVAKDPQGRRGRQGMRRRAFQSHGAARPDGKRPESLAASGR